MERKYTGVFAELKLVDGECPTNMDIEYVTHLTLLSTWRKTDEKSKEACLKGQEVATKLLKPGQILESDHTFTSTYPQWKTGKLLSDVLLGLEKNSLDLMNDVRNKVSLVATGAEYKWPFDDSEEVPQHIGIKYSFEDEKEAEEWRKKHWGSVSIKWEVVAITTTCSKP